ncbi:MAG: ABC transporter substrate-binding protein [Candidatus Cloacimonetes bacterium]|nr:ABC transporter substrate-binding protein [Candidatus Cloacimonadota bacterium]
MTILLLITVLLCCCNRIETESAPGIRLVVISPELAEIAAMVAGVRVIVGITRECDYPPALSEVPVVGTFSNIDLEKVKAINPTVVLTSGLEQEGINQELRKLGFATVSIYPQSIEELFAAVLEIGEITGCSERAKNIADSLDIIYEELLQEIPRTRFLRTYIEIYGNPLMSAADNSLVGEVIALAGGKNIFPELPRNYSRVNPENVIVADPEFIVITYPGVSKQDILQRKGWENISACVEGRICTTADINPDLIIRATPRIFNGIRKLQEFINEK